MEIINNNIIATNNHYTFDKMKDILDNGISVCYEISSIECKITLITVYYEDTKQIELLYFDAKTGKRLSVETH